MLSLPSARIFVAFCSDMPLICSKTLLGLRLLLSHACDELKLNLRIRHRLDRIESTFHNEFDITG